MTDRQILIIKSSWSSVMLQSQETGALFYQKLFELDPALHVLFRNDMELQIRKFNNMMTVLVRSAQYTDQIVYELEELAKRHIHYGVRMENYSMVGLALFWMIEQQLGDRWNEETEQAWKEMYQLISKIMMTTAMQNLPGNKK